MYSFSAFLVVLSKFVFAGRFTLCLSSRSLFSLGDAACFSSLTELQYSSPLLTRAPCPQWRAPGTCLGSLPWACWTETGGSLNSLEGAHSQTSRAFAEPLPVIMSQADPPITLYMERAVGIMAAAGGSDVVRVSLMSHIPVEARGETPVCAAAAWGGCTSRVFLCGLFLSLSDFSQKSDLVFLHPVSSPSVIFLLREEVLLEGFLVMRWWKVMSVWLLLVCLDWMFLFSCPTSPFLFSPDQSDFVVWLLVQRCALMQLGWTTLLLSAWGGEFSWLAVLEGGCCNNPHTVVRFLFWQTSIILTQDLTL